MGSGGAIYAYSGGTLTISNCSFYDNAANSYGGATNTDSNTTVNINNSSFSGNSANTGGGAIALDGGTLTLKNLTISGNSAGSQGGGGLMIGSSGTVNVYNSIIYGNTSNNGADVVQYSGTAHTYTKTLIGNYSVSSGSFTVDGTAGQTTYPGATNPNLGTFGLNGGYTKIFPLSAGSSAIDAGDNTNGLSTDQHGTTRPADGDGDSTATCDLDAQEYPAQVGLTVSPTGSGTVTSSPSGISCGSTCSASFDSGSSVTLTAPPSTGYSLASWSGGGCSGTGPPSYSAATGMVTFTVNHFSVFGVGSGEITTAYGNGGCALDPRTGGPDLAWLLLLLTGGGLWLNGRRKSTMAHAGSGRNHEDNDISVTS